MQKPLGVAELVAMTNHGERRIWKQMLHQKLMRVTSMRIWNICNLWILLRKIVIYLVGQNGFFMDFSAVKVDGSDVIAGICKKAFIWRDSRYDISSVKFNRKSPWRWYFRPTRYIIIFLRRIQILQIFKIPTDVIRTLSKCMSIKLIFKTRLLTTSWLVLSCFAHGICNWTGHPSWHNLILLKPDHKVTNSQGQTCKTFSHSSHRVNRGPRRRSSIEEPISW